MARVKAPFTTEGAKDENAERLHDRRLDLCIFLKCSRKMKSALKEAKPNDLAILKEEPTHGERITGAICFFIHYNIPCYESDCVHPVCQRGRPDVEMTWFEGGPLFQILLDPGEWNVTSVLLVALGISFYPKSVLNTFVILA